MVSYKQGKAKIAIAGGMEMALGTHWEWRGFGAVSGEFARRYSALEPQYPPQSVTDDYLWVSGLEVNVKVRNIPTEPFKFKRLQAKDGELEQWAENPEDIFRFPLDRSGWDALAGMLATVNVMLGPYPSEKADVETTLTRLKEAGARIVTVTKRRESRLCQGPHGKVLVEWTCISSPQAIISIGLETWDEGPGGQGLSDQQAKEDILAAIRELGLRNEPLRVLNYVGAVTVWASGGKV
jgi:hypothetical protein